MKKILFCLTALFGGLFAVGATKAETQPPKVGMVNFKKCVEESKLGKSEQALFDTQKKQMEQDLEKKQKEIKELAPKFNDEYLDSLTPEAEKDLKEKFQKLNEEFTEQQNQFFQVMDQSHFQRMQKIYDMTAKASEVVGKEKKLDFVLNDEVCFYKADGFDVTNDVIKKLDELFAQSEKEQKR